jgi:hypothetical protein
MRFTPAHRHHSRHRQHGLALPIPTFVTRATYKSAPLMRGSRLRALQAFSTSTTTGPPAAQHASPFDTLRARRLPPTSSLPSRPPPRPKPSSASTSSSSTFSVRRAFPYSPRAASSSRLAGLRLDDDWGDRLPVPVCEGEIGSSLDGPLNARADAVRVPLTCSEGRLPFK